MASAARLRALRRCSAAPWRPEGRRYASGINHSRGCCRHHSLGWPEEDRAHYLPPALVSPDAVPWGGVLAAPAKRLAERAALQPAERSSSRFLGHAAILPCPGWTPLQNF